MCIHNYLSLIIQVSFIIRTSKIVEKNINLNDNKSNYLSSLFLDPRFIYPHLIYIAKI